MRTYRLLASFGFAAAAASPLLASSGCSKKPGPLASSEAGETSALDAGGDPTPAPPGAFALVADAASAQNPDGVPGGEAERAEIAKLDADPLLASQLALVQKHFGAAPGPFLIQRLKLAGARRAIIVSSRDESDPLVLAFDGAALAWSKERPTAGMIPPVVNIAITAHPQGGAILFAYDTPTKIVAGRVWADDGSAFADFQVLKVDACDDLSASYWPDRGFVVACAWLGGARAQLLREDGTMAWRRDGVDVGSAWRAPAPVAIAFDTADAVVFAQYGDAPMGAPGDHVLAARYDTKGRPSWAVPIDVGVVPHVRRTRDRVTVTAIQGGVRIDLGRGSTVDLDPAGKKTPRAKQVRTP